MPMNSAIWIRRNLAVQNPFDPDNVAETTGDNFDTNPDGTCDVNNDWDGDGLNNRLRFWFGSNPADSETSG